MNWKKIYNERLVSAQEAISHIHDGDSVAMGMGCGQPSALDRALAQHYEKLHNVTIHSMIYLKETPWTDDKFNGHIRYNTFFASASNRTAIAQGKADYTPCHFSEIPKVLREIIKPRVSIMTVTPPDENGYVSLGTSVDYIESTLEYCEVKIAQVNSYMPFTYGGAVKHISEFDYFVECDEPLPEVPSAPLSDVELAIGKNCASLINDGDCIQLGIGGIPNAICENLKDKKDLGLHSELVGDGVVELLKAGIINNSKKQTYNGKTVLGLAFGTKVLFDYIDHNPNVELHPIEQVNNPYEIAKIDNFISVNSCLQVDLMGQVVSDSMGLSQVSGAGGQIDFVRGAAMSKGGKSIIAMPSTTKNNTISKIVPIITKYSAVTTSRNDVDCIVTEYGIAELKGKTLKDRAAALIKIAHPDFRKDLIHAYESRFHTEFLEKINI